MRPGLSALFGKLCTPPALAKLVSLMPHWQCSVRRFLRLISIGAWLAWLPS